MWKKIVPIAAVLILAWIALNLISGPDTPEPEEVATDDSAEAAEAEVIETSEADAPTEEVSAQSDATSETAAADTDSETATATAIDGETETNSAAVTATGTEGESETDTEAATATATDGETEAVTAVAAGAATDSADEASESEASNVEMRYPTDPVTGATLFDQDMVEVTIEPEPEVTEEDQPTETSDAQESEDTAVAEAEEGEQTSEMTQEIASSDTDAADQPVVQTAVEMRYPTDPDTGLTIYEGGRVEVPIEIDVSPTGLDSETESAAQEELAEIEEGLSEDSADVADADSATESSEGRLPVDPVTGATLYPDVQLDEADVASTESDGDTDASAAASEAESNSLPADPVTGATIYETAESGNAVTEGENGQVAADATDSSWVASFTPAENRSVDIGGISRKLGVVFGTTEVVLATLTDEASAESALPMLESASDSLSELSEQFSALPDYAIAPIGKVVQSRMARLKPMADSLVSKPGVGPVLSPVLMPMMEKMSSMVE